MTRPNRRRVVTSLPIIILAILLAIVFMQKCEPRNEAGKMTPGTNNVKITPEEAEDVLNRVFCYCTINDIDELLTIAEDHRGGSDSPRYMVTVGGQECLSGYYDKQADIAYQSSIFAPDSFTAFIGWSRDYYLQDGIFTYDINSLNSDLYFNKPIIWRIHKPQLFKDAQHSPTFIRYIDRHDFWDRDSTLWVREVMVTQPHIDNSVSFEDYAAILDIDLSQFIYIDIGGGNSE